MVAYIVKIDILWLMFIYASRISICDAFLSQFNENGCKEKKRRYQNLTQEIKNSEQLKHSPSKKCNH